MSRAFYRVGLGDPERATATGSPPARSQPSPPSRARTTTVRAEKPCAIVGIRSIVGSARLRAQEANKGAPARKTARAAAPELLERKTAGSSDQVTVVAQFDRSGSGRTTNRYLLRKNTALSADVVTALGETDTGDPALLR